MEIEQSFIAFAHSRIVTQAASESGGMKDEAIRKMFLEGPSLIVACEPDTYRVSVRDVVEPSGYVETFAEKLDAKHVVLSVKGQDRGGGNRRQMATRKRGQIASEKR